jgi:integrative and conjugative element protein (TIGR02256 family)
LSCLLFEMTTYNIGDSGEMLTFSDSVMAHFKRHQQRRASDNEAGGQLFARLSQKNIAVVDVTGPRRTDKRSRFAYVPDRSAEQREILERHSAGLQFVGDWHTHPARYGNPSPQDLASMAEMVQRSKHSLNGFVLVIVGRARLPSSMYVCVHDGMGAYELAPSRGRGGFLTLVARQLG